MLTWDETIGLLKCSQATLYRWISAGRLTPVKAAPAKLRQPERPRFRRADVLALLGKGGE